MFPESPIDVFASLFYSLFFSPFFFLARILLHSFTNPLLFSLHSLYASQIFVGIIFKSFLQSP